MSDINDDILNYELGDVDIEDVLADDEDDLLLSDEEAPQEKKLSTQQEQQLLDEIEEWDSLELAKASVKVNATEKIKGEAEKSVKIPKTISDVKVDSSSGAVAIDKIESEITTSDAAAVVKPSLTTQEIRPGEKLNLTQQSPKPKLNRAILKKDKIFSPVNEVSSSIEEIKSKPVSDEKSKIDDKVESTCNMELTLSGSEIDSNTKEGSAREGPGSEDTDSVTKRSEVEDELDDEREERLNPKLSVERDNETGYPNGVPNKHVVKHPNSGVPHHENQIPRIGYAPHQHRGPYPQPHGPHSIGNISNEYHPHPQYQSTPNYHNQQGIRGPSIPQVPYRVPLHSGPGGPPSHGPPHNDYGLQVPYRGPRPDHMSQNQPPYAPFNPIIVRPQGNMIGPPRFDQMRPRQTGPLQFGNPNMQPRPPLHQPNYLPPRPSGIPSQNLPLMPNQSAQLMPHTQQQQQPPIMPRKILINPNFKHGGWEAAKSQLIMDNILSKNIISSIGMTPAQNDDELLRRQEAFITQNRIHIEKRRYERSPDRDHRDRDYSPPSRRDRRPYSRERDVLPRNDYKQRSKRDGDNYDNRYNLKRRRSESLERDIKEKVEEDEETRAYRLEIEKQKAMREKIIREKEERRKKAAEDKLNTLTKEKKVLPEEVPTGGQPPKLTPLIVKESKIISLKKKEGGNQAKAIPTAKIIPESKKMLEATLHDKKSDSTTAVVKPQMKTTVVKNNVAVKKGSDPSGYADDDDVDDEQVNDEDDDDDNNVNVIPEEEDDEIDEDALLADSPSPPPTPALESFRTRRVVLKSSAKTSDTTSAKILQTKKFSINNSDESAAKIKSTAGSKGIFDRLDHQKKIGVNESAKRAIKRIVINKSD